jgi:hypothetical protein
LLHANLTVHDVDPTAGDPGAGESNPPGDAQHFPMKKQTKTRRVSIDKRCMQRLVASYCTDTGRLDSGDFGAALVVLRGLKLKSNQSPG